MKSGQRIPLSFFNQRLMTFVDAQECMIKIHLCCHTNIMWYTITSPDTPAIRSENFSLAAQSVLKMLLLIYRTFQEHVKKSPIRTLALSIIGEDLMPLYAKREVISKNVDIFNEAKNVLQVIEIKNNMISKNIYQKSLPSVP